MFVFSINALCALFNLIGTGLALWNRDTSWGVHLSATLGWFVAAMYSYERI